MIEEQSFTKMMIFVLLINIHVFQGNVHVEKHCSTSIYRTQFNKRIWRLVNICMHN